MAQISINVDGENSFQKMTGADNSCMLVDLSKDISGDVPYQRDRLYLHGNVAAMRAFAEGIIAALPAEAATVAAPCITCEEVKREGGFGPSHAGSKNCESGSLASGGKNSHCTCDVCF